MSFRVIVADVLDGLAQLPDESVHCVVTSPPYWGLRDYGVAGQIGLEPTPDAFVARMVEVFREVRRMLRKDGTCWVNMGDSYAASRGGTVMPGQTVHGGERNGTSLGHNPHRDPKAHGLKHKDLMGMPWRVAFALQADGWWLRSDIIWAKPNPMPESVTDRPTKAHEYVFLLTKAERYYYDAEAVREEGEGYGRGTGPAAFRSQKYQNNRSHDNSADAPQSGAHRHSFEGGRNKRSVWTIATAPFPEAHFATFPPELPEICIKAGTSQHGCCGKCGAPWERETEAERLAPAAPSGNREIRRWNHETDASSVGGRRIVRSVGFSPSCSCNADVVPATVLDPFAGAGTTLLVADRLQRNAIGIELNPEYAAMAERRLATDRGGLFDVLDQPAAPQQLFLEMTDVA